MPPKEHVLFIPTVMIFYPIVNVKCGSATVRMFHRIVNAKLPLLPIKSCYLPPNITRESAICRLYKLRFCDNAWAGMHWSDFNSQLSPHAPSELGGPWDASFELLWYTEISGTLYRGNYIPVSPNLTGNVTNNYMYCVFSLNLSQIWTVPIMC